MNKYIRIYEQMCPDDPISADDPRRGVIMAEMQYIHRAKSEANAAAVIEWWKVWPNPRHQTALDFVREARKRMQNWTHHKEPEMFKVGDKVQWTSQALGYRKTKEGEVVQVVPAGERPDRERFAALYKGPGVGFGRNHESYVVRVKNTHYWPRTSALKILA